MYIQAHGNNGMPYNAHRNQQTYKLKSAGASKGHELLKKKSDALKVKFRAMLKDIKTAKEELADIMPQAYISLASAYYSAGDFTDGIINEVKSPSLKVSVGERWCCACRVVHV
jgi:V-type H+-transporting ATPase subunit D